MMLHKNIDMMLVGYLIIYTNRAGKFEVLVSKRSEKCIRQ